MKATITSTDMVVRLDTPDNLVRVWEGETDGVRFVAYIGLCQGSEKFERALLLGPHSPADAATQQLVKVRDAAVRHCRAAQQAMMHAIMSP